MTTKICTKCNIEKDLSEFYKSKGYHLGINSICKICTYKRKVKWRKENLEKSRESDRKWYKKNAERLREQKRKWRMENPVKAQAIRQKWYKNNPEKAFLSKQKWRKENPEKCNASSRKWCKENPIKARKWAKENPVKVREYQRKRQKQRCRTDPKFKLKCNMSRAINRSLKDGKNGKHWEDIVGYTLNKLKKHLQKQFTEGMTWKNYGRNGWVLDHKTPISVFNFTKSGHKDFKRCWKLKNLQPMWRKENNFKGAKLTKHFQPSLLI